MNTKFLTCIFIIVVQGLQNTACKKSDNVPAITYRSIKVLELKTSQPVVGAQVRIYECKSSSLGAGCSDRSVLKTLITANDGTFEFDSKLNVFDIHASYDGYWEGITGGKDEWGILQPITNISLSPIAHTKIHIRKVKSHPPGLRLFVILDKDPHPYFSNGLSNGFDQPVDTTIIVPCYGYMNNVINWYFFNQSGLIDTTAGGQISSYYVSRFDTASVELNY